MKFQLKSAAVAALLLTSTITFAGHQYKDVKYKDAAPCPAPAELMSGFYLGAQAGYDVYDVKVNSSVGGISTNVNLNANGWVGGLMLGYGAYFSNVYYLGAEAFGNLSNASQNFNNSDADVPPDSYNGKATVNNSYGLAVLPGLKISDSTLGYVRLGYNWASIKYQENSTGVFVGSSSKTNTSGGFVYGVGFETLLVTNWSVRSEYTYTNYNSNTISFGAGTKVEPSDNQFMLGLLYHVA